jgi:hypothetical protein
MTKLTNWQKFDNAFKQVSAFVVMDRDTMQPTAKIALKFPSDGAGRVNAYIHLIGMEVQHGYAGGYGYDKRTASIISAASNCNDIWAQQIKSGHVSLTSAQQNFINLLLSDKAQGGWLEVINQDNGFIVIQAV